MGCQGMARSQRSSAAKARSAVQQLQAALPEEPDAASTPKRALEAEFDAYSEVEEEPEETEASEISLESSQTLSEPSEEEEPLSEPEIVAPRRKGRPRKGEVVVKAARPKRYVKLAEFKTYGTGPFPLKFWEKAIAEARPMKRPKLPKRTGTVKGMSHLMRPPTDALSLIVMPTVHQVPSGLLTAKDAQVRAFNVHQEHTRHVLYGKAPLSLNVFGAVTTADKMTFASTGNGAVTALGWCRCCGQYLASASYPSEEYQDLINARSTASGEILIWKHDAASNSLSLRLVLRHRFGSVRDLQWYPFNHQRASIFAASFGDQTVRLLSVPLDKLGESPLEVNIEDIVTHTFENASTFSWCPNVNQLAVGSFDGTLQLVDFSDDLRPRYLFATKVGPNPLWSISWCPENPRLLSIGCYDQSIWLVDLAKPFEPMRLFASISMQYWHQIV